MLALDYADIICSDSNSMTVEVAQNTAHAMTGSLTHAHQSVSELWQQAVNGCMLAITWTR